MIITSTFITYLAEKRIVVEVVGKATTEIQILNLFYLDRRKKNTFCALDAEDSKGKWCCVRATFGR